MRRIRAGDAGPSMPRDTAGSSPRAPFVARPAVPSPTADEPLDAVYTVVGDDIAPAGFSPRRDRRRATLHTGVLAGLLGRPRPRSRERTGRTWLQIDALQAYEPDQEYLGQWVDTWL